MARRKVYIVKSGTFNNTTNEFCLSNRYHTSKKGAMHEAMQSLNINEAEDIIHFNFDPMVWEKLLYQCDYIGEGGKYKARLIVEWEWMEQY